MADDTRQASAREVVDLLRSIDASLKQLVIILRPAEPLTVNLDGPHGDPIVRAKSPRDWTGEDQLGKPFSQCPPAYLDLIAARYDYFASTAEDEQKRKYARLDAARARGWAERLRGGWRAPEPSSAEGSMSDDTF